MSAFSTPVDRTAAWGSNRVVPVYTVTAEDRSWFDRCRRAWDLGALARRGLEPAGPQQQERDREPLEAGLLAALAVHYYPGMWTWDRGVVDPLVDAAYEQAQGPPEGRALLRRYRLWAPTVDDFTPIRVQFDLDVAVPDPGDPARSLAAGDGRRVRYRDRVHLAVLDEDQRCWLVEHRVVRAFADPDELALDERGLLACWAWQDTELAIPVAGNRYTELRIDPPGLKRTVARRSPRAVAAAAARLGRTAVTMLDAEDAPDPTPDWSHCQRCPFREPCIVLQRGDDASALLASGYVRRPPDDLEEGRLGGTSWGMGRGARPPRFG
jgi:hypothetical protein